MNLHSRLISLLFLCLICYSSIAQTDKISEVENSLTGKTQAEGDAPMNIQDRMSFYKIKGLSIAVIQDYKIAWAKGYGWADEEKKIPVTPQTLFQAASISKSLNGVGLLKLAQDKKLDLNADINDYLSHWKFPYDNKTNGKKITVASLLSHSAGLTIHGFPGYEKGKQLPTVEDILNGDKPANTSAVKSMYAPETKTEYSGGGITISQLVLTDITRQSYETYMDGQILKPMGMLNSTYAQPPTNTKPELLATGYKENGKEIAGKFHIYPEQAAAGLWTNPTELALYIIETQLAYEGRSAKVLNREMTQKRLSPYFDKSSAMGVFVDSYSGTKYFAHGGSNEGFRSEYYGSIEGGNGIVIMVNSDNGGIISELVNSIAKVYQFKGLNKTAVVKNIKIENEVLDSYCGVYALTPTFTLTITNDRGVMGAQATGQQKFTIYPESQTKFFAGVVEAKIEFKKDDTGKIISLTLYQNGQQVEAKKIR